MPKTLTTHIFEFCRARKLKFSDFSHFNDKIKQWKFYENLQCSPWRLWSSWHGMILKQEWISEKAAVTNTTIFSIRDIPRFSLIKCNVHKNIYITTGFICMPSFIGVHMTLDMCTLTHIFFFFAITLQSFQNVSGSYNFILFKNLLLYIQLLI